ncbi:hypothetical protein IPM09_03740 [Candidatus Saccharibacteria bacterium]|nr:MAG: hypothetical protein IPM09_03740 [Candidatus Saccharibacteria bacterium]
MSKIKISSEELRNIAARQQNKRDFAPKPNTDSARRGLAAVAASLTSKEGPAALLEAPAEEALLPATASSVADFVVPKPTSQRLAPSVEKAYVPTPEEITAKDKAAAEAARRAELDTLIAEQAAEMAREAEAANRATHPDNYDTPKDEYLQSLEPTDGDALREERNAYDRFRRDTAHIRDYEGHVPFDSNDYGASQDDAGPDDPLEGMQIERPYVPVADRKSHK